MHFGNKIKDALYKDWIEFYVDYSGLKRFMKDRQFEHEWNDNDEKEFIKKLEHELVKVSNFQSNKIKELTEQINTYEEQVKLLVSKNKSRTTMESQESEDSLADGIMTGETDDSDSDAADEDEDRFLELEEDLANIIADVYDLGHFSHLNYTAFVKIVKKHDKHTGYELKGPFMREFLDARPFYKENYESIIVQLSRLYNLVRTRGHPTTGDSSAGGNQSAFVRQTTKYWVHPDNFVQLKLFILKYLPVLVFNPDKPFEAADTAVSSIYFDNESLDLYLGRLEKEEGAEAIRLRWYGDTDVKTIFVERKTHREDWTGEKSVKARFPIKEELVDSYIHGEYSMDETFEELRRRGKKSDKEINAMIRLASEVQDSIRSKKLRPVMRTFYNRTAFQLPADARVRISFDTQLTLVREDNFDGVPRAGDHWRREDIGINWPFDNIPAADRELFPYGVLEVKLQTQHGQEPPEWVKELVSSHLVEAVPKFSKFIHGCATLLPTRVDLVPFWLPQMETSILKPATAKVQIQRPGLTGSSAAPSATPSTTASATESAEDVYTEPVSDDENDGEERLLAVAADEAAWTDLPARDVAEAKKQRERNTKSGATLAVKATKRKLKETFPKLTPANLRRLIHSEYALDADKPLNTPATGTQIRPGRVEYVSSFRAPTGKRIAIPVRVEPKVYFANERTMLAWLEFSIILSAIGLGLLSRADPDDNVALVCSTLFTMLSLASITYTISMYVWRFYLIRRRAAVSYHDKYGPTVLCGCLIAAILVNSSLRLREGF